MKHLHIAFGLILAVGLMTVTASPALGTPKWITCEQLSKPTGKWTTNKCTIGGTGEWETKEISSTIETTSTNALTLEDKGEKAAVECTGEGSGTVGKGGTGSVKTITNVKCGFATGKAGSCEESKRPTAKPVNLPWSDRLEERTNAKSEKEIREVTTSSVAGKAPGWSIECTDGVLKVTDECTGVYSTNLRAERNAGPVAMEYEEITAKEPANCTIGGKEQGLVHGSSGLSLYSPKGEAVTLLSFWTE